MLSFKAYVNKKGSNEDPLEKFILDIQSSFSTKDLKVEIMDFNDRSVREELEEANVENVPSLLINNKVRISGKLNEYFLFAVIGQLLTDDANETKLQKFTVDDEDRTTKLRFASSLLYYHSQMRPDTQSFLLLIRENPDIIDIKKLKKAAENGTTVYILTNFKVGKKGSSVAALGEHENILLGHIERDNMHMTISITIRKNRPFFGSFVRAKYVDDIWKGQWSAILHDTVNELKKFYLPLFQTATPVHLDGSLHDPPETNRVIAKVKDSLEYIKKLF